MRPARKLKSFSSTKPLRTLTEDMKFVTVASVQFYKGVLEKSTKNHAFRDSGDSLRNRHAPSASLPVNVHYDFGFAWGVVNRLGQQA